jgi:LmbE family N-acetylglucosaminyl deacetylase
VPSNVRSIESSSRSKHLKILVLSPHRDDAAFSLSLAITNWLTARHSVTVLNVFTRSRFAPYSDAAFVHENDELSYVSAMRLREDELWIRRIKESLPKGCKNNLHMLDLNLKDAPIRLRIPLDQVSDTAVNPADPSIEKIRRALARHFEPTRGESPMQALVIPAALGHHVDHLTVREAALSLTATIPAAFYEDLPYLATHTGASADLEALRKAAVSSGDPLTEVLYGTGESATEAVTRKRKLVLHYASQIDDEAGELIANFAATYKGAERVWVNSQWVLAFPASEASASVP